MLLLSPALFWFYLNQEQLFKAFWYSFLSVKAKIDTQNKRISAVIKTLISTIKHGQNYFGKHFIFCNIIFCIKKQNDCFAMILLSLIKKDQFFGMCSSVSFTPRSLVSADSPRNSSCYFSIRKYYFWECKGMLSGILNVYSKNWLLIICL